MKKSKKCLLLNLQLFADGGTASGTSSASAEGSDTAAEGTNKGETVVAAVQQKTGGRSNAPSDDKYGMQKNTSTNDELLAAEVTKTVATKDRSAKFEELIKGEYKDLYDAKMQDTIQKRLKSTKETVDKYNALNPTLELLASKYGVEAGDFEALNKAIQEDDAYYEDEAMERGLTVSQLKEIKKMERENAELKKQMEEQSRRDNANKLYSRWMNEAEQTKSVYPAFNFENEMQNPKFLDLLRSNIDVRTAYEVIHKDEIIPAAMSFTASKVEQKLTNKIIANGSRPTENGNSSQGSSVIKSDVSQLSKAQRAEINRRAIKGEKIRF